LWGEGGGGGDPCGSKKGAGFGRKAFLLHTEPGGDGAPKGKAFYCVDGRESSQEEKWENISSFREEFANQGLLNSGGRLRQFLQRERKIRRKKSVFIREGAWERGGSLYCKGGGGGKCPKRGGEEKGF